MKKTKLILSVLVAAVLIMSAFSNVLADSGSGRVSIGFVSVDEDDNRGVNQETFNTYEGFSVSLEDFQYSDKRGYLYRADLRDISLNNRNLFGSVTKPGLFGISINNNQYRRNYGVDNGYTRRYMTDAQAFVHPIKGAKIFLGVRDAKRHGQPESYYRPEENTFLYDSMDVEYVNYNVGGEYSGKNGLIRFEYLGHYFFDDINSDNDRQAKGYNITGTLRVPGKDWITFSGGYFYRLDEFYENDLELKSNQMWGGARLYLPNNFTFDGRVVLAKSERDQDNLEVTNNKLSAALGKTFPGKGGLKVGYETRTTDDDTDKTSSGAFIGSGWARPIDKLFVSAKVSTRSKTVDEGATLTGDEDVTYHKVSASYDADKYGKLSAQWFGRIRDNKDIGSRAEYNGLSSNWKIKVKKYGSLNINYAYYLGQFENAADSFEFSDHVVSAAVYPAAYGKLTTGLKGTYYRSRRDHDLEKFSMSIMLAYEFIKAHSIEFGYNVHTYDDLRAIADTYTANIFEVKLIKDLEL